VLVISIIFLSAITLGIISSVLFLILLRKSTARLPEGWRRSAPMKNFKLSILFLTIFLILAFFNEFITGYLARNNSPNGYVFSIFFTTATFLIFGFLFIHTQARWKQIGYVILYSILIGYLVNGGYYHPLSTHPTTSSLLLNSLFFLAALLHLTDLLIHPKTDHFKFKLKICLIILIFGLMADILTSFYWSDMTSDHVINFPFLFMLQLGNMLLFYFSFACVFTSEIIKLRRSNVR
jgi:hypothetical protein